MTFFDPTVPPLRRKQINLNVHEAKGLWLVNLKIGNKTLHSTFYTRLDQACILWSILLIPMFATAQFLPVSWSLQAGLWTILSLVGTTAMIAWTGYWVKVERVSWALYCWVFLMLAGLLLTDLGIFLGWGQILMNLCPLWLGLSALGYFATGIGVRSRALILTGVVHLVSIFVLPYIDTWQFIATGGVMVFSLLLLAEFQWDMRLPIDYAVLTKEDKKFNQKQHSLRSSVA